MKTLLEKALKVADGAEIYKREVSSTSVSVLLGDMQGIEAEKKTEISLRIVKNGKMGMAVSTSLEDESIIERALISLENQSNEAEEFPNEAYDDVQAFSEDVYRLKTEDLVDMAFDISHRFKALDASVGFSVYVDRTYKKVNMINSSGFDGVYQYTNLSIGLGTLNQQGFRNVTREFTAGHISQVTDEHLVKLLELHRLSDHEISLENEKMPVVFDGTVMGSLMLRVVGGISGGNITKKISPVSEALGQQIFSEKITIRDDATHPLGCNTYAFDDEGIPAQNTVLYEHGVLRNYLLSISHAKKLNATPTGNAQKRALFSKEIEDVPAIFDSNLIVEGDAIPDETIFKSIKRGLYITGVMGAHTGNIVQGEFSMNISSGYLIEEGKLVGKVKGAMIAGNIYELFKHVEGIGTELKPMRSIFYNMGYSPMVWFSEANIVGK